MNARYRKAMRLRSRHHRAKTPRQQPPAPTVLVGPAWWNEPCHTADPHQPDRYGRLVSRPSSSPRGEHTPAPGVTWERFIARTETVVDDPKDTSTPGANEPLPPRPNRATRRALARAARRNK